MTAAREQCSLEGYLPQIERMAHRVAWQLVKQRRIERGDEEDFAQDLLVHVVRAWPRLAGTDFRPLGFAQLIIRQKTSNELRKRQSCSERFNRSHRQVDEVAAGQFSGGTYRDPGLTPTCVEELLSQLSPQDRERAEAVLASPADSGLDESV